MTLPAEILLLVAVVEEPTPESSMRLWDERDAVTGALLTPVFSTMERASAFLAQAMRDRHPVRLDYIFRYASTRFQDDFPDLEPILDPTAGDFFARAAALPPYH